jgi:two-component system phosphate regulon response regulator PhoB
MRILVIEDDLEIQNCLHDLLEVHGHTVLAATNGVDGIELAKSVPDLIFCDIAMPAKGGYEVISTIRGLPCCQDVPFVFLTARAGRADQRYGMSIGADDYITKPFSMKILVARVRAALRRRREPPADKNAALRIHDLEINPGRHEVLVKGKPVEMTFSELRILHALAARPGWVLTREQIVDAVRGEDYAVTDRAVDVQIVGIRRKLGTKAECIETVRGVGYRFKERE